MAAGTSASIFSLDVFLSGVVICLPFAAGFSCMGMVFYMIRHPSSSLVSVVMYFLIGAALWGLVIPQVLNLEKMGLFKVSNTRTENQLTEGYFRPSEYGVFYYSKISSQNIAEGLYIDTSGSSSPGGGVSRFTDLQLAPTGNEFFSDPLFEKSVSMTVVLEHIITFAKFSRKEAFSSLKQGYFQYLSFASLGLALLSLISVKSLSSWKLLNLSFVIILYTVVCRINLLVYTSPLFNKLLLYFQGKQISFLSSLPKIQLVINCSISAVLLAFGMVQFVLTMYKKKRAGLQ